MDRLQFSGNDPGAVTLGNFINYYDFHPPEERLKFLPDLLWCPEEKDRCVCLDIGCNTGELTSKMYEHISQSIRGKSSSLQGCQKDFLMLGVDIDPVLIERAKDKNNHVDEIVYECLDFMSDERILVLQKYLCKCNGRFDIVFCFSVTMWIHLNHGDDGLNKFLKDISEMSTMLVIEPQPWKCYKSAVKRLKRCQKAFPYFQKIAIRDSVEQHIESFLLACSFIKIHESVETKWGRKLLFFIKQK